MSQDQSLGTDDTIQHTAKKPRPSRASVAPRGSTGRSTRASKSKEVVPIESDNDEDQNDEKIDDQNEKKTTTRGGRKNLKTNPNSSTDGLLNDDDYIVPVVKRNAKQTELVPTNDHNNQSRDLSHVEDFQTAFSTKLDLKNDLKTDSKKVASPSTFTPTTNDNSYSHRSTRKTTTTPSSVYNDIKDSSLTNFDHLGDSLLQEKKNTQKNGSKSTPRTSPIEVITTTPTTRLTRLSQAELRSKQSMTAINLAGMDNGENVL